MVCYAHLFYHFGFADNYVHIPQVMRLVDDSYLSNDFFLDTPIWHMPLLWVIGVMSRFVPLYQVFFIFWFFSNLGSLIILGMVSKELFKSFKPFYLLLVFLAQIPFLNINYLLVGVNVFPPRMFVPSGFCFFFILSGLYLIIKGKYDASFMVGVLASYIHLQLGIYLLALSCYFIFKKKDSIRNPLLLMFSSVSVIPLFYYWTSTFLEKTSNVSSEYIRWLVVYYRHPHHFLVAHNMPELVFFTLVCIAGLLIMRRYAASFHKDRYETIIFFSLGLIFLAVISTEILPFSLLSRLQLMRISVFPVLLSVLALGKLSSVNLESFRFGHLLTIILLILSVLLVILDDVDLTYDLDPSYSEMGAWVKMNTNSDAVFITPPYEDGFRTILDRAIVADFKNYPFFDADAVEWAERIAILTKVDDLRERECMGYQCKYDLREGYLSLDQLDILIISDKYDADYLITEKQYDFPMAYSNEKYTIFRLHRQ